MAYEVRVTPAAERGLAKLPPRAFNVVWAFLETVLPVNPQRVGKPLRGELTGLHSARRGDYRVIYEIFEDDRVVVVHRVDHRAHVYRSR